MGTFEYIHYRMTFFALHKNKSIQLLCLDVPEHLQIRLRQNLDDEPYSSLDGSWVYKCLLEEIVEFYGNCLWSFRHLVRRTEHQSGQQDPRGRREGGQNIKLLHELARHASFSSGNLQNAVDILDEFTRQQQMSNYETPGPQLRQHLRFLTSLLRVIHRRSELINFRIQNQISLLVS